MICVSQTYRLEHLETGEKTIHALSENLDQDSPTRSTVGCTPYECHVGLKEKNDVGPIGNNESTPMDVKLKEASRATGVSDALFSHQLRTLAGPSSSLDRPMHSSTKEFFLPDDVGEWDSRMDSMVLRPCSLLSQLCSSFNLPPGDASLALLSRESAFFSLMDSVSSSLLAKILSKPIQSPNSCSIELILLLVLSSASYTTSSTTSSSSTAAHTAASSSSASRLGAASLLVVARN
jgi:hypothetical protein